MAGRENNRQLIALLRASVATAVLIAVAAPGSAGGISVSIGGHPTCSNGGGAGAAHLK